VFNRLLKIALPGNCAATESNTYVWYYNSRFMHHDSYGIFISSMYLISTLCIYNITCTRHQIIGYSTWQPCTN